MKPLRVVIGAFVALTVLTLIASSIGVIHIRL